MQFFTGRALCQKGPQSAGLGTGHAQSTDGLGNRQVQQTGSGGSRSKGADDTGGMPATLAVAGHIHAHADPAHDLITHDDSLCQLPACGADGLGHGPGGGDDDGADVGFRGGVYIVQLQLMAHQAIDQHRRQKICFTVLPPGPGTAMIFTQAAPLLPGFQNGPDLFGVGGTQGTSDGVQNAVAYQVHGFPVQLIQ